MRASRFIAVAFASLAVLLVLAPSGATTGPVMVTTPGGALTSNVSFRIIN